MAKFLEYNGEKHTLAQWAKIFGVNYQSFIYRIEHGIWIDFELYFGERNANNPSDYVTKKIFMLENDFYIRLTPEEKQHFHSLTSESAVDQYAHDIIMKKL